MPKFAALVRPMPAAAVLAAGIVCHSPSALPAEGAALPYSPPVGSRWTIVTQGSEEKIQDGKSVATITSTRKEELAVVEKTATGYRISSVLRDYEMHGDNSDAVVANALLGALRDVVVRAEVDQRGKPVRIDNLDEVVQAHRQALDKIVAAFSEKPQVAEKIRELLTPVMESVAKNPNEAAQWYLETVAQLSGAQDTGLGVGEERHTAKTVASPFGGEIKTNVSLRLEKADTASGRATLVQIQTYDPEALKEFIAVVAKKVAGGATAAELEKVTKEMSLSMDDRTEFSVEQGMTRSVSEDSSMTAKALGHAMSKHEHNQITVTAMP